MSGRQAREDYPLRRHGRVDRSGWIIEGKHYDEMCDELDRLRAVLAEVSTATPSKCTCSCHSGNPLDRHNNLAAVDSCCLGSNTTSPQLRRW